MKPYAEIAEQYARDVTDGRILACKWVRLACQRHLDDMDRAKAGWEYRFDPDAAARVCSLVELLPHTKGKWAARRQQLVLEPWQVFILSVLFGWLRVSDGLRRFRIAYVCVPRKNGKSALAAGVGLYMFAADGEHGAEVYSNATSEAQAWEVFRPAKQMAERTPPFLEAFGIEVAAKSLYISSTGSRFQPVIGKPGDGSSPSCAIIDEYHEHASDEAYDTMLTGMGARQQPLQFVITTAGGDVSGPCYALQSDVQKVLEGTIQDEELFGIVYTIDEDDDWTSDEALRKANPNYGISVDGEFLRARQQEALRSSRRQTVVKTKHLNVWVSARNAWMNMQAWNALAYAPPEEEFDGETCWAALDLASKIDLTAQVRVYKRIDEDGEEHYYAYATHYLPEARVEDPEARHYQGWVADGHLVATDGAVIDYERVEEDVAELADRAQLAELAYDPWGATQLAQRLADEHGINIIEVTQTVQNLSEPMKWLEGLVLAGRLHHTGDPVLTWSISNVVARVDAKDNIFPRKERPEAKIDPAVALIMAVGRAQHGEASGGSVYEHRGVMLF